MDSPPYPTPTQQTPQLPLRHHFPTTSPTMSQLMHPQTQLDEGFSEETRSQSDSEMMFSALDLAEAEGSPQRVLQHLMALPADQREYIISQAITTLNSLAKGRIGRQIVDLTHFDPAHYLPNEVFLQICSYLSPRDLLSASIISRDWRSRSQDEKLWRACFAREGWVLDRAKMEEFEKFAQTRGQKMAENLTRKSLPPLERKCSRKRKTEEAFSGDEGPAGKVKMEAGRAPTSVATLDGAQDGSRAAGAGGEADEMEGVETEQEKSVDAERRKSRSSSDGPTHASLRDVDAATDVHTSPADFKLRPELFQAGREKLSWPYLYKQRRRLEANWEAGRCSMFQLPHRDFPHEGHEECVYTIQHTTKHLVSGSRDKTIRIWDLDSSRLKGKPLRGHEASVLCLQFDERPEHDIIVSGGSDAYVIIWKFSTGEIIKKMTAAHDESVLNLRFDDRYIVTCSKDKTIKIWSRHELPRNSPLIPMHVLRNFNDPATADLESPIAEYSLLATFFGHHAAVNAVMIHDTTIVSASGDRTIKAWDLHTGHHKKSYNGHQKGIACVQFDGRRVVSGSSDNTVRIFDAEQQAEIACLSGHTNLVRTVQARFGDLETTTDAELQEQAREADRKFYQALSKGMQPATASRRGPRNAGSSRPEEMQSVGTKIPPGGGGSRWAKIVSGSYDETVIVWKRDPEGKWQVKLRLHQDTLLRGNRANRRRDHFPATGPVIAAQALANAAANHHDNNNSNDNNNQANSQQQPGQRASVIQAAQQQLQQAQNPLLTPGYVNGAAPVSPLQSPGLTNRQGGMQDRLNQLAQNHHQQLLAAQQQQGQTTTTTTTTSGPSTTFTAADPVMHATTLAPPHHNPPPPALGGGPQGQATHHPTPGGQQHHQAQQNSQLHQTQQQNAHHVGPPPPPPQQQQQNPNQPAQGQGIGHMARVPSESNRVFKLQFDARRIVCCSQNRTIVGWDFANGDADLERIGGWSVETA